MYVEEMTSTSHRGEKMWSYSVEFNLEAVKLAQDNSVHEAARKFKVNRHNIRDWKNKKVKLQELNRTATEGAKTSRLDGAGQKLTDADIEERVSEWIFDRSSKGLRVSRKMTTLKARSLPGEKYQHHQGDKILSYGRGCLEKFMKRNGLSFRCCPTEAQTLHQPIDKLCGYILKIRRLRSRFNYELKNIIATDDNE